MHMMDPIAALERSSLPRLTETQEAPMNPQACTVFLLARVWESLGRKCHWLFVENPNRSFLRWVTRPLRFDCVFCNNDDRLGSLRRNIFSLRNLLCESGVA
mmetsp:Transcript_3273/g.4450  ORF Transcript_3273/g.4450 Transcript_3273/m.4450 type:complete len:101 (+) Transcript_3273:528-830(+)